MPASWDVMGEDGPADGWVIAYRESEQRSASECSETGKLLIFSQTSIACISALKWDVAAPAGSGYIPAAHHRILLSLLLHVAFHQQLIHLSIRCNQHVEVLREFAP